MADYTAADFSPRKHCNKQQEMAVRRAYDLNAVLMDLLEFEGTVDNVKRNGRYYMFTDKRMMNNLFTYDSPEYVHQEAWEWTVDHWYSGGLKRSVEVTMHNMHPDNVKAIKGKVDELYG